MCRFRVAYYQGDDFQGVVAGHVGRVDRETAEIMAQRYNAAYPYHNGRYCVVEMTDSGCILK